MSGTELFSDSELSPCGSQASVDEICNSAGSDIESEIEGRRIRKRFLRRSESTRMFRKIQPDLERSARVSKLLHKNPIGTSASKKGALRPPPVPAIGLLLL